MKYILKQIDKMTCDELGEELGIKVTKIERSPDGTMHIHTAEEEKDLSVTNTATSLNSVSGMKLQDIKTVEDISIKSKVLKEETIE